MKKKRWNPVCDSGWKKIFFMMRITVFFLFAGLLHVSASVYSQQTSLSLKVEKANVSDVLKLIEEQSDFQFLYRSDNLNGIPEVTIDMKDAKLEEVLDKLIVPFGLAYEIDDRTVVIKKSGELLPKEMSAQQPKKRSVSGKVTDAKGQTLPGASIVVKGTTNGVISAINGTYNIANVPENATLQFSFVGMKTQEFLVGSKSIINVFMEDETVGIEDVVVVGYGVQKKVTVVGAITTINTKELRQSPTTNLSNALAGRMSGMMVNQFSGGEPGVDQSQVFVRGMSTYNNQNPIVIVDGIERDFQYLSPDEVETFSILKDASATAVYGVRGANGVILVTTRRGKVMEKASVTFKASTGVSAPIKFPDYLGSADYAMLYNEARLNDNPNTTSALFTQEQIDNYRKAKGDNSDGLGYNTNLFDYAFKPSMQQDYSLNIQGGTKTTKYFVLVGYMNQNGNYQHTNDGPNNTNAVFKRYNFRSNIDINITDDFYVKLNLGGRIQNRIAPGTTASRVITIANTQPSIYPVILENNDNPANALYTAKHPEGLLFG